MKEEEEGIAFGSGVWNVQKKKKKDGLFGPFFLPLSGWFEWVVFLSFLFRGCPISIELYFYSTIPIMIQITWIFVYLLSLIG